MPEYHCWAMMIQRCINPKNPSYRHYGGRGIAVCDRWSRSFDHFYADIGKRPSAAHSLDRIDNDGDYEPGNCRWATAAQQRLNTRPAAKRLSASKAAKIIALFGGGKAMAEAIRVDQAVVSRWTSTGPRGEHGEVPLRFHARVREAAIARKLPLDQIDQSLVYADRVCPTCGTILSPKHRMPKEST